LFFFYKHQMLNNEFYAQLKSAIASGNAKALEAISSDIDMAVIETGLFPEERFESILAVFQDRQFLGLKGSWKLIRVFEQNWHELSEAQRSELLPALEASYESFDDWMACFVISGILGEQYQDQRALSVLQRLKTCANEIPRSFVPHGLEHIAGGSVDPELVTEALTELKKMELDSSEVVRKEVHESFSRLSKQQIDRLP